jgi:hypothetical protein
MLIITVMFRIIMDPDTYHNGPDTHHHDHDTQQTEWNRGSIMPNAVLTAVSRIRDYLISD